MASESTGKEGAALVSGRVPNPPPHLITATKKYDLHHAFVDSTAWDAVLPILRPGDLVVDTYSKAGTTWVQAILAQLLLGVGSSAAARPHDVSPWLDVRSAVPVADRVAALATQSHRRFLKSHLPLDALPYSKDLKYLYIGRDARDVIVSMHNHHSNLHADMIAKLNDLPGRVGPPLGPAPADIVTYWREWMARDGYPWWPFWSHIRGWWAARNRPNVLLLHYADLLGDLPAGVRRIATFLDVPLSDADLAIIVDRCSFRYMREHAADVTPGGDTLFQGGARTFIHKGVNGRWRDVLSPADVEAYEATAVAELGEDCARWLREGGECA
ncbi:hypothetical protein MMPV_007285 [Pyropia vietnamensis]